MISARDTALRILFYLFIFKSPCLTVHFINCDQFIYPTLRRRERKERKKSRKERSKRPSSYHTKKFLFCFVFKLHKIESNYRKEVHNVAVPLYRIPLFGLSRQIVDRLYPIIHLLQGQIGRQVGRVGSLYDEHAKPEESNDCSHRCGLRRVICRALE